MSSQIISVDLSQIDTTPKFRVGQLYTDELGNTYRYMQADGAVTAYEPMSYRANTWQIEDQLDLGVTPADTQSVPFCVWDGSSTALADDEYAWVFVGPGIFTCKVAGNVAADALVYGHATAGQIDDAATAMLLRGVSAPVAITASAGETGTFHAALPLYAVDLP